MSLKSQVGTSSWNNYGGIRKLPYVFTEHGVAMLATVLRTPVAEEVSIRIMDAFVAMRKYIPTNFIEQKYINDLVLKDLLEDAFSCVSRIKTIISFLRGKFMMHIL